MKNIFHRENYLNKVTISEYRIAITNLCHKLPLEIGRYNKIPREFRICNLCPNILFGDEFHLICECSNPRLHNLRIKMLNKIEYLVPTFNKLSKQNQLSYLIALVDKDITNIFSNIVMKCCTATTLE